MKKYIFHFLIIFYGLFLPGVSLAGTIISIDTPKEFAQYDTTRKILVTGKYDTRQWNGGQCEGSFFITSQVDGVPQKGFHPLFDNGVFAYRLGELPLGEHILTLEVSRAGSQGLCKGERYTIRGLTVVPLGTTTPLATTTTMSHEVASMAHKEGVSSTGIVSLKTYRSAPEPTLFFDTTDTIVSYGATALLRWQSKNVSRCEALGDWQGEKAREGVEESGSLYTDTKFTLLCRGEGGEVKEEVAVKVAPEPISAALSVIPKNPEEGESVVFVWSGDAATKECSLSGLVSGGRVKQGRLALDSFSGPGSVTLSCVGYFGQNFEITKSVPEGEGDEKQGNFSSAHSPFPPLTSIEASVGMAPFAHYFLQFNSLFKGFLIFEGSN